MTLLYMLFGAVLVAGGVCVSALADRIRGIRLVRERQPTREAAAPAASAPRGTPARGVSTLEADVIDALTGAGYSKRVAASAVAACAPADRASIEKWTMAALRAAHGGAS